MITDDCKPSSITALDLRSSRPQDATSQTGPRDGKHQVSLWGQARGSWSHPRASKSGRRALAALKRGPLRDVQDNCSTLTCAASQRCRSSCPTFQCQPVCLHCNLVSWFNLRAGLATHCLLELYQWSECCGRRLVRGALADIALFPLGFLQRWSVVALPLPQDMDGWSTFRSGEFGILPRKAKEHIPRLA